MRRTAVCTLSKQTTKQPSKYHNPNNLHTPPSLVHLPKTPPSPPHSPNEIRPINIHTPPSPPPPLPSPPANPPSPLPAPQAKPSIAHPAQRQPHSPHSPRPPAAWTRVPEPCSRIRPTGCRRRLLWRCRRSRGRGRRRCGGRSLWRKSRSLGGGRGGGSGGVRSSLGEGC